MHSKIKQNQLVFIDTEFVSFEHPYLLSIGATTLDGETFYRQLSDAQHTHLCSSFVRETVLPLFEDYAYSTSLKAFVDFQAWLTALSIKRGPIFLMSDSPMYDTVPLRHWTERHELPWSPAVLNKLLLHSFSLNRHVDEADFVAHLGRPFKRHHALDDAKQNAFFFKQGNGVPHFSR
jgi:3' exoribonuclease, RNase T-like